MLSRIRPGEIYRGCLWRINGRGPPGHDAGLTPGQGKQEEGGLGERGSD